MKNNNTMAQWVMCPPRYFGVEYVINPWMEGHIGLVHHKIAERQWQDLFALLSRYARVHLIPPQLGLPDMTFTANAGLVRGSVFVPAQFYYAERRGEEAFFHAWFEQHGFQIVSLGMADSFEGEGDALFQPGEELLWAGYGFRTELAAHARLSAIFAVETVSLHLVDPYFYHLDTCFAPLPGGRVIYYPPAFDEASQRIVQARIPAERRLEVSCEDAQQFLCNAIVLDDVLICNDASVQVRQQLQAWGYQVYTTPLNEFMRAGGAAKCLALDISTSPFIKSD